MFNVEIRPRQLCAFIGRPEQQRRCHIVAMQQVLRIGVIQRRWHLFFAPAPNFRA